MLIKLKTQLNVDYIYKLLDYHFEHVLNFKYDSAKWLRLFHFSRLIRIVNINPCLINSS